jgi:hypothetical protein
VSIARLSAMYGVRDCIIGQWIKDSAIQRLAWYRTASSSHRCSLYSLRETCQMLEAMGRNKQDVQISKAA